MLLLTITNPIVVNFLQGGHYSVYVVNTGFIIETIIQSAIGLGLVIWGACFRISGKYWVRVVNIVWSGLLTAWALYGVGSTLAQGATIGFGLAFILVMCCIVMGLTFIVINIISLFKPKE